MKRENHSAPGQGDRKDLKIRFSEMTPHGTEGAEKKRESLGASYQKVPKRGREGRSSLPSKKKERKICEGDEGGVGLRKQREDYQRKPDQLSST